MVGGDHRDRTVGDALDEGETVLFRTQRRIHLVIRAVSLDALVGQRQVVRRRFAGDRNPLRPGVAEQLHALLDADMLHMDLPADLAGEDDVAGNHELLGGSRNAVHPEQDGPFPFVHDAIGRERLLLAVVENRQIEGFRVFDHMAHERMVLNAAAVVTEGNHAGGLQRTDAGHLPALVVLGHAAAREHMHHSLLRGGLAQELNRRRQCRPADSYSASRRCW